MPKIEIEIVGKMSNPGEIKLKDGRIIPIPSNATMGEVFNVLKSKGIDIDLVENDIERKFLELIKATEGMRQKATVKKQRRTRSEVFRDEASDEIEEEDES